MADMTLYMSDYAMAVLELKDDECFGWSDDRGGRVDWGQCLAANRFLLLRFYEIFKNRVPDGRKLHPNTQRVVRCRHRAGLRDSTCMLRTGFLVRWLRACRGWASLCTWDGIRDACIRTPVILFRRGNCFVIALTYGRKSEWVRNVAAQGGCELETGGRKVRLTNPYLYRDEKRRAVPAFVRIMLGVLNVSDFLELTVHESGVRIGHHGEESNPNASRRSA